MGHTFNIYVFAVCVGLCSQYEYTSKKYKRMQIQLQEKEKLCACRFGEANKCMYYYEKDLTQSGSFFPLKKLIGIPMHRCPLSTLSSLSLSHALHQPSFLFFSFSFSLFSLKVEKMERKGEREGKQASRSQPNL